MRYLGWRAWGSILSAGLLLGLVGCGGLPQDTSDEQVSTADEVVLAGTSVRPPAADQATEVEPNDDFTIAQPIGFNETVRINGSIAGGVTPFDRDVYDLGPASYGDRVIADVTVTSGTDVVLGVLDSQYHVLGYIDMISSSAGPRQSDFVVREATDQLFVVVGTRSGSDGDRAYTARISVQRGLGEASERPQVLVLNFLGASGVKIGNRAAVDVPPFDAAKINPNFGPATQTIIESILQKVRVDFEGLNVAVYLADDPALPAGDHSTIYFGTYDSRLLGLADNVDPYNSDTTQSAILYTDTFSVFNALYPSVGQISQALANTTSHEAGHLLGLRHTADPTDLMDTTASARQMMLDQDFSLANINSSVLPIGLQDAPVMLAWALGGELIGASNKAIAQQRAIQAANAPDDFYIPREMLMDCGCTECTNHQGE